MIKYINEHHIDIKLKEHKLIREYIRNHYNKNNIMNSKRYNYLFYIFKEDCISLNMSNELYNLLLFIYKQND